MEVARVKKRRSEQETADSLEEEALAHLRSRLMSDDIIF